MTADIFKAEPVLDFEVLGEPTAQKRHRHFSRLGKSGKMFVTLYDPSKGTKESFISIAHRYAPEKPLEGPLRVDITFWMPRPKNHYGSGKNASVLKPNASVWHDKKPDKDNLEKMVLDSMKGVFWKDDNQIAAGISFKVYSEMPRTTVKIYKLIS